jgi:hypothetical protein
MNVKAFYKTFSETADNKYNSFNSKALDNSISYQGPLFISYSLQILYDRILSYRSLFYKNNQIFTCTPEYLRISNL